MTTGARMPPPRVAARSMGAISMRIDVEAWPRSTPVRITGHTWHVINVIVVALERDGYTGRGEASGVYFKNDTVTSMHKQLEKLRSTIEAGISRDSLQALLPPGGARNALDCALWDLEAQLLGSTAWQIAGMEEPVPLLTAFTCHADTPENMARRACGYEGARAIKLKLTGEEIDANRVRAVRDALPHVWLSLDANQGFTRDGLERLMPILVDCRVALIEQPFPIGHEALLDGFDAPIPIAADESVIGVADLAGLCGRFQVANIKLDKCGGLTEGLEMVRVARALGLRTMVGNMGGTSLAMAPAHLLGQFCDVVDLDGPVFLTSDRERRVEYTDGYVFSPKGLWGGCGQRA